MVGSVSKQSANGYSKLGSGASNWGYNGTVFEPDDSVKGDFARIYLYSIARYENACHWLDDDGDICFSDNSNVNYGFTNYAVKLFTYWNNLDKPSEWELSVSEKVSKIHGCKNPFVERPYYVNLLFEGNAGLTPYQE